MFGQVFSNDTIKKYVIFFGSLFNDIYLTRDNSDGTRSQTFKVPLNYGPREKFLSRLEGNPDLDRPVAIQLPMMSFEIVNIQYAPERKLPSLNKISAIDPNNPSTKMFQYYPVPYDFEILLSVMVKNAQDGARIVEQIIPFFTPDFTATLNLNGDISGSVDVPLILNRVTNNDNYEGSYENRRVNIWTFSFTLKGYMFGPTRTSGVIKEVDVYFRIPTVDMDIASPSNTPSIVDLVITPGLTANGEPTSNASLSIDKNLINSTDNYGYIIDFTENI